MSNEVYPFIYICSLMRTGSTLLSEALTRLPYAFIFREPHLGKNYCRIKPEDRDKLQSYSIDLESFLKNRLIFAFWKRRLRWLGYRQDYMVRSFKEKIFLSMMGQGIQVGVKEINNWGWQNYAAHFLDMKVLITGRDPRDIFLSLYYRNKKRPIKKYKDITPAVVATDLNRQFGFQLEMHETTDNILVRYEDLCSDKNVLDGVKKFVGSPIIESPAVGHFIADHPIRQEEHKIHGNQITDQRVQRWKTETNKTLVAEAEDMFELMSTYTDFWGYTK